MNEIWVFDGDGTGFPLGVFTKWESAEAWILKNQLTGTLAACDAESTERLKRPTRMASNRGYNSANIHPEYIYRKGHLEDCRLTAK